MLFLLRHCSYLSRPTCPSGTSLKILGQICKLLKYSMGMLYYGFSTFLLGRAGKGEVAAVLD
jgi:hypothetical protein